MQKIYATIIAATLGTQAQAATNTLPVEMPSVVRLTPVTGSSFCSGAVVGTKPLTVITAFHCIVDYQKGGSIVHIPGESDKLQADPEQYISTKVTIDESALRHELYPKVKSSFAKVEKLSDELKEIEMKLQDAHTKPGLLKVLLDPKKVFEKNSKPELEKQKKEKASELMWALNAYMMLQRNYFVSVLEDSKVLGIDVAVLQFENYEGPLNDQNENKLLEDNKIMPLSPNTELDGKRVAFAGYGMKDKSTPVAMGAFTNVIQAQMKNILAVYGLVPNTGKEELNPGQMGAILPGDSGGPLFTNTGIVGIASFIKNAPMESLEPPTEKWPQDKDGYYSYFTGRFMDLASGPAQKILDEAADSGASIVENDELDLALTQIHNWEVPESILPEAAKENIFAGVLAPH